MPKFEVHRAEDQPGLEDGATAQDKEHDGYQAADTEDIALYSSNDTGPAIPSQAQKNQKGGLYLYEEDMKQMPHVSTFLKSVMNYHTTLPSSDEVENSKKKDSPKDSKAKLGIVLGVYLPTIQHIFGVLMFVRLAWIVGCMGTIEAFGMVFMCCLTTFVTCLSMSAIATNGAVHAGGSYFMISRNLGPEVGGAVGICFYLANTFAVDLYILGAIEIFLQYMAPGMAYFGDIHHNPWNNYRLYGTIILILLALFVAVGVKVVQMFAPIALCCVIITILSIFIGAFIASPDTKPDVMICLLGDRLMSLPKNITDMDWCNKNSTGDLYHRYCHESNGSYHCDSYFDENTANLIPGIPGMASGVIMDNLFSQYLGEGEVSMGVQGDLHHRGEVIQDISTTFVLLCAIYFPSVTGIMTGSNMSGDLKDPQASIPKGTILAQLTTSFVYLSFVLLFGSTTHGALLRDKYGASQGGSLLASLLCWPNEWVVLVGAFCSTIGAALQCLTSAPRLLQAIARDNIIPFLEPFTVTTAAGEPIRALIITTLIAEIGIIIAAIDYVAPVIDTFFLICYAVVNVACALQTLLKAPSWRPRFKYYHWTLSVLGVILNLTLAIMAGWYFALASFSVAGFIYKYIEYKGCEKEWGDGIEGLSMSAAQKALLKLEEEDPHTKNWRPQLLVLCKMSKAEEGSLCVGPKYQKIFSFASQLKAGKGLTICASVMEGNYAEMSSEANITKEMKAAEKSIKSVMAEEKVKGFAKVIVTKDIVEGINIAVHTIGLGGMRHNTVILGWPCGWQQTHEEYNRKIFIDTVRAVTAKELALLVPRNINNFPGIKERLNGTIDIWWIVHDGGMLILVSFLLKQHKVWKNCKLRLFTVAQITDNSIQLKNDLQAFLYQLRIDAEVFVEEMYDSDISAYTYERTLDMEKRASMLQELKHQRPKTGRNEDIENAQHQRKESIKKPGRKLSLIQEIVDASHMPKRMSIDASAVINPASVPSFSITMAEEEETAANGTDTPKKEGGRLNTTGNSTSANSTTAPLLEDLEEDEDGENMVHFTFTPADGQKLKTGDAAPKQSHKVPAAGMRRKSAEGRLMRMHTAVRLNEVIKNRSSDAELVIMNFPAPPARLAAEENYMEYLEALTDNIKRVVMVRGSGKEVVTIYS